MKSVDSFEPVARLLSVAGQHPANILRKRREDGRIPDTESAINNVVWVTVFSAAAIEAGLNTFITTPLLLIPDENLRAYFGVLATKHLRLNMPTLREAYAASSPSW
jgi:hypothetical protein